jgi:4-amino-4-deoxy-L-arabinose transferase-like glycosyltransferase
MAIDWNFLQLLPIPINCNEFLGGTCYNLYMQTKTKILLLSGIIILASFLRLYHITTTPPGLYPDEAMDGVNALEIVHGGHFQAFYIEDNGREGLYVNILVFFIKAFGNQPWVVRLPAAIAGILTVLGMYFLVAELFRDKYDQRDRDKGTGIRGQENENSLGHVPLAISAIALLSAFLLATSFWHINFSRIGFRAILAPLCLVWALYFLIKAVRGRGTRDEGRGTNSLSPVPCPIDPIYAILAGVFFGAGFYTYIAYRVTPLLLLLFIPFFKKYPGFWKKMLLFLAITFVVALPIGIYFLQHPGDFLGRTSQIAVMNSGNPIGHFAINAAKTLLMFNISGDGNWRHNIAGAPELWWPVGILFVIGILWSMYYLWKWIRNSDKRQATSDRENDRSSMSHVAFALSLTLSWFILALLPAAASDEGLPHALRSILMLPPAIIFAALGGMWAYGVMMKYWSKNLANAIVAIFIVIIAANAYFDYFVVWAQNPNVAGSFNADYVAIGDQINALPQNTPKYVVVEAGGVLARGIPVPAETVMFVTDSFTTSTQIEKHITYLLPDQTGQIPADTPSSSIFYLH